MTRVESTDARAAERRWAFIGLASVLVLLAIQVLAGVIREAVSDEPTHLELVQTCLTERATPFEEVVGDPIALSAGRGALRTTVEGAGVTVALGSSEQDAKRMYDAYLAVASDVESRLELNRKAVFLWEAAPTSSQHDFMVLCTLDAQE